MLNFNNVALRRGAQLLFSGVTFVIHRAYKLGLTGTNGTGKSSFLQLVLGQLIPDEGTYALPANLVFASVAQETAFGDRPAIEVVIDGDQQFRQLEAELLNDTTIAHGVRHAALLERMEQIQGYSIRARAAKLMQGLGFRKELLEHPALQFSGGWRMRLNLARALMCRSDILLLDEPTNHLDLEAVIWLQDWLKNYPGTLLLISHDREFLDGVTDHIAHIENQSIKLYAGNYSAFEKLRADYLAQHESLYLKQQREVQHIRSFVDRFRAKATKAKQVQSRLKALQWMDLIVRAQSDTPFSFTFQNPKQIPDPLLRLTYVSAGYADRTILDSIDLTIRPGDRIGLLGPNGAGKSTLIKLLAGEIQKRTGKMECANHLFIGYFAQHQLEQLNAADSPLQHLKNIDRKATERDLRQFLGGFAFSGDYAIEPVGQRSGGEKARLVLAMLAYQRPNLLLLDEPTNHLDIRVRDALSIALQDYTGALVIVSHDRHLLRTLTDQFILVNRGRVSLFDGDLDDYGFSLQQDGGFRPHLAQEADDSRRHQRRVDAERRNRLRPMRARLEKAESDLDTLQNRRLELEHTLSDSGLYAADNKERLRELLRAKSELDRKIGETEEIWMRALQQLEDAENNIARTYD